ncbi:uncharacterized protein LOC130982238 [Arachis stenosperma]|uniref:uncharacterized protein LOC130982238 n=1 Tax=Arachis stenosperma TaxID=217475 RepID=UPI0025AD4AC6|nr:uncharacterized protein LOC130982238 [Arachis stenosperma]
MAPDAAAAAGKKRKRYLPHNKPVKKKGSYPLRPGVQGFFITCDGGREHQASREAFNILESFYEELVHGENPGAKGLPNKPMNTKITFADSDSSSSDDDAEQQEEEEKGDKTLITEGKDNDDGDANCGNGAEGKSDAPKIDDLEPKIDDSNADPVDKADDDKGEVENKADEPPAMNQCSKTDAPTCNSKEKGEQKSIDRLIEEELEELGDKNKRRFLKLDSGCNGVVFVQMRRKDGDKSPKDIVHQIVTSAASTRKHMSRFILRILPIEVSCYASKEEISRAIKPLVEQHFPVETQNPQKFAVLYEARANTGVDRMEIIDAVAKSVPAPHKVDLSNPDKTIIVEIARTVCLIGVIEKYKEFSKYNLRQLASRKA